MKKIIALLLSVVMMVGVLAGCGASASEDSNTASNNKDNNSDNLKIVTTIFPEYDWVRQVLGDEIENVDLTLLLKNGVDLHSYQPTTDDLIAISSADMFVYVGGPSDMWVEDALKNATNKDMVVVNLFDVLGDAVKPMVLAEGMEHHHHDGEEHDHHDAKDEHVWLSLPRAETAVKCIAEKLSSLDAEHADAYTKNANDYVSQLDELNTKYQDTVNSGKLDTIVFADRFPFFYLADDYGLNYFAAFTGCSAESEASFETVAFLANKIDQLDTHYIFTIENCTHKIPETIIENTAKKDQEVLVMDSLQSVTTEQIENGLTYLDVMTSNLDALKEALC